MALIASRYDPFLKRGGTYAAADIGAGAIGTSELEDGAVHETDLASSVQKIITGSFNMANASASYIFAVQNPESSTIFVDDVEVDITTAGGAAGTLDVGTNMVAGASADQMYVGKSLNAVARYSIAGTATGSILKVTSSAGYVIGDLGSGTTGNVAGTYRIIYHT